jgi:hypothetical protein
MLYLFDSLQSDQLNLLIQSLQIECESEEFNYMRLLHTVGKENFLRLQQNSHIPIGQIIGYLSKLNLLISTSPVYTTLISTTTHFIQKTTPQLLIYWYSAQKIKKMQENKKLYINIINYYELGEQN